MQIQRTKEFASWFTSLRDRRTATRIADRLNRLGNDGHFGTTRNLGDGLSEMKLDFGSGYRPYYSQRREQIVLLLLGGDKRSQQQDIKKARKLLIEWDEEP